MTTTYPDLLRARAEVIAAQMASLETELEELRIAERVYARLGGPLPYVPPPSPAVSGIKPGTVRSYIAEFLRHAEEPWVVSADVHAGASKLKGTEIPTGTIYPTLSEMVRAKIVTRDGSKVALAERVRKKEAPISEPMEAS